MPVPAFARSPWFWWAAFAAWFLVLWKLSSGPMPETRGPEIPGFDKVLHFGYFFGGAGLLGAALSLGPLGVPRSGEVPWRRIVGIVTVVVAAVGLLDEWHQSWVPDRSGNNPGDWLADACGALCGALVFRRCHRLLLPPAS
jgi:VanZ family protein